jgi:hypothetical protein
MEWIQRRRDQNEMEGIWESQGKEESYQGQAYERHKTTPRIKQEAFQSGEFSRDILMEWWE